MGVSVYVRRKVADEDGDMFDRMMKMSTDFEGLGHYDIVTAYTGEQICSCPARQTLCRHVKMLPMFDLADADGDPEYRKLAKANPDHEIFLSTDGKRVSWVVGTLRQEAM